MRNVLLALLLCICFASRLLAEDAITVTGAPTLWNAMTFTITGPVANEDDESPNPFTDFRLEMSFIHASGVERLVQGYFAADGNAAESSATSGDKWRVHFVPDQVGQWTYHVRFVQGKNCSIDAQADSEPVPDLNASAGEFQVSPPTAEQLKQWHPRDLRRHGLLNYVGKHHLQFAGSKKYFLKAGADAPETLLAYQDFDNTLAGRPQKSPLKSWSPHLGDWLEGDPTWQGDKGKGLIGAINYLSSKGCNAFSFLTYNAGGDGDNVWPFALRDSKLHYDCSKLDQWQIVFGHGVSRGMYLHFKLQETENDDNTFGESDQARIKPESLDGGDLGNERKLYCRELVARFGHNLALNWNIGEENTQTTAQVLAMANYIATLDPYHHPIVIHTYPNQQEKVYRPLLFDDSPMTGASLQNSHIRDTHAQTVYWVDQSQQAGRPWVVAFDESGSAAHGQCPDLGYRGYDGHDLQGNATYTEHDVRKQTLWGNLMGGGAGVEYYFGYQYVESDLTCEDWRSRDRSWEYCGAALKIFDDYEIPFWEMQPADEVLVDLDDSNDCYCLAHRNFPWLVYFAYVDTCQIELPKGDYTVTWVSPKEASTDSTTTISAEAPYTELQSPAAAHNSEVVDWLAIIRPRSTTRQ